MRAISAGMIFFTLLKAPFLIFGSELMSTADAFDTGSEGEHVPAGFIPLLSRAQSTCFLLIFVRTGEDR